MRILPHSIDTLLLTSGVILMMISGVTPLNSNWLLLKLIALVAYILFGMLALKRVGQVQWLSYFMATCSVSIMLLLATQKSTNPWLWLN